MNKVYLIGRTTKDIEVSYTQSQKSYARFTLAVNRRGDDDKADFISCIAWNKTAEIMEKYVRKGHRVGIAGRIQTGSYKKGDTTIYTTDVVVEELEFLQTKSDLKVEKEPETDIDGFMNVDDSELPF